MKRFYTLFIVSLIAHFSYGQVVDSVALSGKVASDEVYSIRNKIDIPITAATTAYSLWGMSKIYGREKTPQAEILALNYNDINSIDRSSWDNRDLAAKAASDKLFYGSMPLPLVLMLDKEIRKDALKIGLLYLEAMGTTGTLYTSSAMIANRFRPYTYNAAVDMDTRTRGGGRNSFFAGHPGLVATATFFTAKVFSDYHPNMRNKWMLYTAAAGASLATGILRIKGGEHFPTDVATGLTVGTLSGLLIPHFHKVRKGKWANLNVSPNYQFGQTGFRAVYHIR